MYFGSLNCLLSLNVLRHEEDFSCGQGRIQKEMRLECLETQVIWGLNNLGKKWTKSEK